MLQMDDISVPLFPHLLSYNSSLCVQKLEVLPQNMLLLKPLDDLEWFWQTIVSKVTSA